MSNQRYPTESRDEAVRQVLERGYSVKEVLERLGVSTHSLYKWIQILVAIHPRIHAPPLQTQKNKTLSI